MTAYFGMLRQGSWTGFRAAAPFPWSTRSLPARRRRTCTAFPKGPVAVATADEAAGVLGSITLVQQLIGNSKVNKTSLGKLTVGVLREECARAGLPTDGTKPVLVERLLAWATAQLGSSGSSVPSAAWQGSQETQAPPAQPAEVQQGANSATNASALAHAPLPAAAHQAVSSDASADTEGGSTAAPPEEVTLTFLGTSSGNPTSRRNVSSIAVRYGGDLFVVDAGEGSRNQLRRAGLDAARVRRIFITHLHGDHCFGVCGLLTEICQARLGTPLQRDPILVYGPPELHSLVAGTFRMATMQLSTPVVVVGWVLDPARAHPPRPVDADGMLQLGLAGPDQAGAGLAPELAAQWQAEYDQGSDQVVHPGLTWTAPPLPGGVRVVAAQLQHRIPCWGYVFQEPSQLVDPPTPQAQQAGAEAAEAKGQSGEQWVRRGRKLVVLGDTCDSQAIAALAKNCDVMSHEATFMRGMEYKAEVATHSTSDQAGAFACQISAKALILTHFSARYDSARPDPNRAARGGRHRRDSGAGGGRGRGDGPGASGSQGEGDLDEGQLQRIVREAQSTFGSPRVYLASDYYTFKVHPHSPRPLAAAGRGSVGFQQADSDSSDGEQGADGYASGEDGREAAWGMIQRATRGRGSADQDPQWRQRRQEGPPGRQQQQQPGYGQQRWGQKPGWSSSPSQQQRGGYGQGQEGVRGGGRQQWAPRGASAGAQPRQVQLGRPAGPEGR